MTIASAANTGFRRAAHRRGGEIPRGLRRAQRLSAQAADPVVVRDLKRRGLLLKTQEIVHSYPFCWRCDTPLIYYARSSWFIRVTAVKDRLIAANRSVNWMPENIKEGRMGNFLENVIDWGLFPRPLLGHAAPRLGMSDCGEIEVIGSRKELSERTARPRTSNCTAPTWTG